MFSMFVNVSGKSQNLPDFLSKEEKKFVKNVINMQDEAVVEITKRKDKHIVIEFKSAMYVLKPDGFIGESWILGNEDWVRLGTEEEAY